MKIKTLQLCSTSLLAICAVACGSDDEGTPSLPANAADAVENYADIVYASYADSLAAAQELDAAVGSFVAAPSEQGLTAARTAWLASREPYLQTEVYRFYDGPIDNPDEDAPGPEGLINAWPLDEQYIDYVVGGEDEGMVNDPMMTIDKDTIIQANEGIDEKSISTGYHAIEFLLWGQDMAPNGPGNRPFTDYVVGEGGTAANQERRGQYLTTVSDLLVENLQTLVDAWDPDGDDNYRADFLALEPAEALGKIMSGMIILSGFETGGERVQAALDTHDQEDEHSCFSDNTHRDMVQDVRGVRNVWTGEYVRSNRTTVEGTSLREVIAAGDADVAQRISDRIDQSLTLAGDIEPPFDQEIAPGNTAGNARVLAVAESLFEQSRVLEEAFQVYGLTRIPDPTP
jgi:putative iron-regulated protein